MIGSKVTRETILQIIAGHALNVLPELSNHVFRPDDRLADLGANSVDRAEIVMSTLSSLSLRIPLVDTLQAKNIGELANLLHDKL